MIIIAVASCPSTLDVPALLLLLTRVLNVKPVLSAAGRYRRSGRLSEGCSHPRAHFHVLYANSIVRKASNLARCDEGLQTAICTAILSQPKWIPVAK